MSATSNMLENIHELQ